MGLFITFEGSEGSGKTTQISLFEKWLLEQGLEVLVTREPGGTVLGESIRGLLLSKEYPAMHSDTELLLMFAARAEHLQRVILPALSEGKIVLCDRFTDASYAYQGAGRGLSMDRIAKLESWVQEDIRPDLTFVLDLPVEEGLSRASKRAALDRFESQEIEFFERVRQGYLNIAREAPHRVKVIDSGASISTISSEIVMQYQSHLASNG